MRYGFCITLVLTWVTKGNQMTNGVIAKDEVLTPQSEAIVMQQCLVLMTVLEYIPFAWLDPFDDDEMNAADRLESLGIIRTRLSGKAILYELSV